MYQGPDKSLSDIRNNLLKFDGGEVNLNLDSNTGIATLCLNNPLKRNAMSGKMMTDLSTKIQELEGWQSGKGVILFGADRSFCSGGDLDFARATGTPEHGYDMSVFMQDALNRLQCLPMLSVALVDGSGALGGGAEIAVSCDFRLATNSTVGIGFVHAKMGIIPAWGGVTRLVNLVGYRTALNMLSTANVFPPEQCRALGLIDDIIQSENALDQAKCWLASRTCHDVSVVRAMKQAVTNARNKSPSEALDIEKKIFAPLWGAAPNKAALARNIKHVKRFVK